MKANGIALDGIDPEANVIHWADIASKRLLASIDGRAIVYWRFPSGSMPPKLCTYHSTDWPL